MSSKALVVGCDAIKSELDAQSPSDWTLTHTGAYAAHEETTLFDGINPRRNGAKRSTLNGRHPLTSRSKNIVDDVFKISEKSINRIS